MDLPFDGPFTHPMACEAGLSRRALQSLLREQVVRRVLRGVYVPAAMPDDVATRARSLALVTPEDCVVVDRHAGWLLGAQMVLAPGEDVELRPLSLYRPAGSGRLRNQASRSGERDLRPGDIVEVHGLRVTSPLRTAWDLGRVRWTSEAISGLDAMFRLQAFTREEFLGGIERFKRMRWVTVLRAVGPLADGRSESPGESILRLLCFECQLTGMVPQVEVWRSGRLFARLDLADEDLRAAVEYDGAEWHAEPEQRDHDARRRAELTEGDGWLIEAFTKDDLFGPGRDVDRRLNALRINAERRRRAST